jgi:hypothetical protein
MPIDLAADMKKFNEAKAREEEATRPLTSAEIEADRKRFQEAVNKRAAAKADHGAAGSEQRANSAPSKSDPRWAIIQEGMERELAENLTFLEATLAQDVFFLPVRHSARRCGI